MEALFSCTKCLKRCPFDDLSRGEQLCKDCRNNFPVVKCTYCRAEFQQSSKGSTNSICAKCAQNVKHYGKPTACENCSVLAAFIGNRCQRCVNSEKKWGPPLICEQCKLKCAFDRPEKRAQGDGRLMCWLCDQAYKRVLAKTRKAGSDLLALKQSKSSVALGDSSSKSNTPTNNGQNFSQSQQQGDKRSFEGMTVLERLTRIATSGGSSRGNTPPVGAAASQSNQGPAVGGEADKVPNFLDKLEAEAAAAEEGEDGGSAAKEEKEKTKHHRHHHHHHRKHHHGHHHHRRDSKRRHSNSKEDDENAEGKKSKSEKTPANGVASAATPKSIGTTMTEGGVDTVNSENVILITQLREQIESLKKQMAARDQQLLEKDKKISELKAQMYETDKEFRLKINNIHTSNASATEILQTKVRELTRQVASLSKGGKKSSIDTSSSSQSIS